MPRIRIALAALATLATLATGLPPGAAEASTPTPGRQPWNSQDDPTPTTVTHSVECTVVEVRDARTLIVRDETDREHEIQIPEKARIRAQSKREFDGKRKLEFEQLRPGHELELKILAANGEIVSVTVLKAG